MGVVGIWTLIIIYYNTLPEIIPIHYNGTGQANSYGNKVYILTLPLIATILFAGLTFLNKFPHFLNYPVPIAEENAFMQYSQATRLIRYLKFIIIIIFGLLALMTIKSAQGKADGLGTWFFPVTAGLLFIPIIFYLVRSFRSSQ